MMRVTYLAHSGFFVETEKAYLLFDYFEEEVPERKEKKPFYVFVSHAHADHFNPEIFNLGGEDIRYFLAYDTEKKVRLRHLLQYTRATEEQIRFVRYDEEIAEGALKVRTIKSNDRGVAYIVQVDGKTLYYAGDLNLWIKEGAGKAINNNIRALFFREMEKIKGLSVDAAFLPVDPGLGEHMFDGIDAFCEYTKPRFVFPMHMWKEYRHMDALVERIKPIELCRADAPGKCFEIP